ncbi:hypothetical protein BCV72DRAFT_306211 [Rhizopus microsporus var. microsporus]|uniref:U6 snRNA phosphodiesterase 1 n=1 Tax=Rhizopus microsporus var. microsporus TaxID=86635 RepID=A0A1X0R0X9_RHIZD|nr:hypothetical protein BCV72DRAFT_306211 [Rhizopus microsporus var. microsporus]
MNSLVDYESSSDEERTTNKRRLAEEESAVERKLPKLSSFFYKEEIIMDSQGKIRTVRHKENSWATHIYCTVDLSSERHRWKDIPSDIHEIEEQHISLSRCVFLKEHQLEPFSRAIETSLRNMSRFKISFAQLSQLTNDEATRSFLTLEIGQGYNQLSACQTRIDRVMEQYNLPVFYKPPRFHTSIAWALKASTIDKYISQLPSDTLDDLVNHTFWITRLYIKMGNRVHTIRLS